VAVVVVTTGVDLWAVEIDEAYDVVDTVIVLATVVMVATESTVNSVFAVNLVS